MSHLESASYTSVAVIGRIPFDNEDTCHIYSDVTMEQALTLFEDDMYCDEPEERREENREAHDCAVFVTSMLVSDSPIQAL